MNGSSLIPEGVMVKEFSGPPSVDVMKKYSLPDRFLFFPAQLWSHKNYITVLKALVHLRENSNLTISLVMTRPTDFPERFSGLFPNGTTAHPAPLLVAESIGFDHNDRGN
jgi:hypothetical protein